MTDYIERAAAIAAVDCTQVIVGDWIRNNIQKIPAADVAPVKHGKWLKRDNLPRIVECKCSVCGYADYPSKNDRYWFERNYCPNCGADMREVDDET